MESSPAVADGVVYVGSDNDKVYAFVQPLVAPSGASPSADVVDVGQPCGFSVSADASGGMAPYSYQWLSKSPGAGSYSAITGATTESYSWSSAGVVTGTWSFELQVTDAGSEVVTSNAFTVLVLNPATQTVLFSDGFESGTLNAWTPLYGTLSINSQIVNSGHYSVESSEVGNSQNLYYHVLGTSLPNPIDVREYVYIDSTSVPSTSGDFYQVAGFASSAGGNYGDGEICVFNVGGTLYWGIYYRDAQSTWSDKFSFTISNDNKTSDAHPVSIGWNCIELEHDTGTTTTPGEEQLYLNGVSIINIAPYNYDRTPYSVTIGGSQIVAKSTDSWTYYTDDVVVASGYIGPVFDTLTTSTNYGSVTPTTGAQNSGSAVTITASPPAAVSGERYIFLGWTGTGIGSYTGSDNPASVTMTDNITETAAWDHQYYLTVTSVNGSPSPLSGWYDSGTSITASIATPVSGGTGTQYVCTGWSGAGSVPASGSQSALTFTITSPSSIVWNWQTQYYLTISSAYGTPGVSEWVNSGTSVYATVSPLVVAGAAGTQYVFTGWSGAASGTTSPSNAIVMSGPETATANWQTQYYLTVSSAHGTPSGAGWYNASASAYASTPLVVAGAAGTQYVFTGWSGAASGTTSPSNAIVMSGPETATANWQTQYYLTFVQSGVSSDFSGTVVTVNGTVYGLGGFSAWVNPGNVYTFSFASPLVVTADGEQYLLTGVSGSTVSPLTVSAPTTVTGAYVAQYYFTATSTYGVPSPASGWFNNGTSVTEFVGSPISGGSGTQYACAGWSGTGSVPASGSQSALTFTITAASNIAWNWQTQYLVSFAVNPSGDGTTSPSGTDVWEDAGSLSIFASPTFGYEFSSWSSNTSSITFGYAEEASAVATISGPGTITVNLASVPTPTPTSPTPIPTSFPSPSPKPTSSPSPTTGPSASPSQSPSPVNNNATILYVSVGVVIAVVVVGLVVFIFLRSRKPK